MTSDQDTEATGIFSKFKGYINKDPLTEVILRRKKQKQEISEVATSEKESCFDDPEPESNTAELSTTTLRMRQQNIRVERSTKVSTQESHLADQSQHRNTN